VADSAPLHTIVASASYDRDSRPHSTAARISLQGNAFTLVGSHGSHKVPSELRAHGVQVGQVDHSDGR